MSLGNLRSGIATAILALLISAFVVQAADNGVTIDEYHHGIYLKVLPVDPAVKPDISLLESSEAMDKIKKAIDLIYEKSSFNADALNLLKSRGDVVVIYDPGFPEWSRGDIILAAFLPNFYEPAADAPWNNVFVAMLGRYIIKHSPAEIAAEGIVHELVGHGIQHMYGRLTQMNSLNMECEASLYEMQAFQDLGVDLYNDYMVNFRREFEDYHCDDFKRFMQKHKGSLMSLWDESPLDVKVILTIFDEYLGQLPN